MIQQKPFGSARVPARLVTSLVAGTVLGVTDIMIEISLAALIFSGALSGYISAGIGYFLFGAFVIGLITSLASSFPNMIALPQDTPAVILGLAAAGIAAQMAGPASSQQIFYTVVATMALASLLTGLLFLLLGTFRLGNLIRYIPYPVIGGFLAGTGWLLFQGGMGVLVDVSLAEPLALFRPGVWLRWVPGLAVALLLLVVLRRYSHPLILPGILISAIGLFYVVLFLGGVPVAAASAQGWLVGPFPAGGLWQPLTLSGLRQVEWTAILAQSGAIGSLVLISLFSFLLNASGLELAVRRDIDLNRELRMTGLANSISGLGGGPVGYPALSLSMLSHKVSPHNRGPGIVVTFLYGFTLVAGASFLSYFPTFLLGSVLLFLGLDFLVTWIYDTWFKLSRAEYGIVLLILVAIGTVGVLEGVALGILLAVVLFVIDYSRVSAVKHTLSGASYRSKVDRPRSHWQILRRQGDRLYVLELQGFLFFGTANGVLEQVRQRLGDRSLPPPRFVVLDFRQAHSLDASAALSISKIKQLAQVHGFVLIFTDLAPNMQRQLEREVLTETDRDLWRISPDLDHALEWCEEQILEESGERIHPATTSAQANPEAFSQLLAALAHEEDRPPDEAAVAANLLKYVDRLAVDAGHVLIRQGDPPKGLYFIETGQATAQLALEDGRTIRLRTMRPGTIIGELGLYARTPASASVVALEPATVYFLSAERLEQMEHDDPEIASVVHRTIARLVSERLMDATDSIRALLA